MQTEHQNSNRIVTRYFFLTELIFSIIKKSFFLRQYFSFLFTCISIYIFFLLYINIHSLPDILTSKDTIISLIKNKSFNIAYNIIFLFIIYIAIKLKANINYVKQDIAFDISVYCCSFIFVLGLLIISTGEIFEFLTLRNLILFIVIFWGIKSSIYLGVGIINIILSCLKKNNYTFCLGKQFFVYTYFLLLLEFFIIAVIRYPASIEWDAQHQIEQFLTGNLVNNWPVFSSVIIGSFAWLGHSLFNSYNIGVFLFILFQMTVCATVFVYSLFVMYKLNVKHTVILISSIIYLFLPIFSYYSTSLVKDTLYSAISLLFVIELVQFTFYNNSITNKKLVFLFIITLMMCLLRHNGVYGIIACIFYQVIDCLFKKKVNNKRLLAVFLCTVLLTVSFNKILLPVLKIPSGSVGVAYTIPFQQTARYVKTYPDELTENEKKIINSVLDYSIIGSVYNPFLSDYVVNTFKGFSSTNIKDFLLLWLQMGVRHPGLYVEATLSNCLGFFFPDSFVEGGSYLYQYWSAQFAEKISYEPFDKFDEVKRYYIEYCLDIGKLPLLYFLSSTAIQIWLCFYLFLYCLINNRKYLSSVIPQFVLIFVCIASPTFIHNGARYALPILFTNIFVFCIIKCRNK